MTTSFFNYVKDCSLRGNHKDRKYTIDGNKISLERMSDCFPIRYEYEPVITEKIKKKINNERIKVDFYTRLYVLKLNGVETLEIIEKLIFEYEGRKLVYYLRDGQSRYEIGIQEWEKEIEFNHIELLYYLKEIMVEHSSFRLPIITGLLQERTWLS